MGDVIGRIGRISAAGGLICTALSFSAPAWAIQSHPEPEGLYVHQSAHVFFVVSMAFLVYWLETEGFTRSRGWRYIQISACLFILWNIVALCGHYVEETVPRSLFKGDPDLSQRLIVGTNVWAMLFYILKLDHVVCVPAIVCLFLGIRRLHQDVSSESDEVRE
jgi:hypothetical protein